MGAPVAASYSEVIGSMLPLWLAEDEGLFTKHGLDVSLQFIASGTTVPALLSGQVSVAGLGGAPILNAVAGGANLVVAATLSPVYPYVFEVTPDIKTIDDLRGKKVGVSAFGSESDTATRLGLQSAGLDPARDVTIVPTGSLQSRTAAMLAGAVQGGVAQPPDSLTLEAQGFHPLFDMAQENIKADEVTITAPRAFVQSQRDTFQRFIDAVIEAIAVAKQDKPTAIRVLEHYFNSTDENAMSITYDYFVGQTLPSQPYPEVDQFAESAALVAATTGNTPDVAAILDRSFIQSAVERGLAGS